MYFFLSFEKLKNTDTFKMFKSKFGKTSNALKKKAAFYAKCLELGFPFK